MKGTGVVRMPWCETLRKWVNWMLRWLGYLWTWIFKVKLYLGNGRPDCHGMGQESIAYPDVKHNNYVTWGRGYCYRRGDFRCQPFHQLVWLCKYFCSVTHSILHLKPCMPYRVSCDAVEFMYYGFIWSMALFQFHALKPNSFSHFESPFVYW